MEELIKINPLDCERYSLSNISEDEKVLNNDINLIGGIKSENVNANSEYDFKENLIKAEVSQCSEEFDLDLLQFEEQHIKDVCLQEEAKEQEEGNENIVIGKKELIDKNVQSLNRKRRNTKQCGDKLRRTCKTRRSDIDESLITSCTNEIGETNPLVHGDHKDGIMYPCMSVPCECPGDNNNCIWTLKTTAFHTLTFAEKQAVIQKGRPTPSLKLIQQTKKTARYFNSRFYDNYKWLCGCTRDNKMYCWPCFLFSKDRNVWNKTGYADLNNFSNAAKKHDQSTHHLNASLALHSFEKVRKESSLSRQFREEIERHNAKVDRNRNVMRRLIDITCYLAKQELPFGGNFIECIKLLANHDGILSDHLQSASADQNKARAGFSGFSNRTQNDLINGIAAVIKNRIRFEIEQTEYVAVMIDETPDVSGKEHLCLILRYFDQSNEVVDRFVGFVDVSSNNRTAEELTKVIIDFLIGYKCKKLIAQTYDGAAVLCSKKNGVQKKVREMCPDALFVWCNAHILNLVLSKSCQRIVETKHFFSSVQNLATFFHATTKRSDLYNKFCSKKLPPYNSSTITVIFGEHENLLKSFNDICENEANWDGETLSAARMIVFTLNDFEFNYFLAIFAAIFVQTDMLFNITESKIVDIGYCVKKIEEFKNFIDNFSNDFDKIYEATVTLCGEPKTKRNISDLKLHYKRIFREILENIQTEIAERYIEINRLRFFRLLDQDAYSKFKADFPDDVFSELKTKYNERFDFDRLKNELICLYSSSEFAGLDAYEIIRFCEKNNMCHVFPQLVALAKLVVTIPASGASAGRSFDGLKRIHAYLRTTRGQERLSNLAIISIEKELMQDLKRTTNFYDDVLNEYLKRDRRIDLIYKK